jgi:fatty-acyl-CoA synthase
VIPIDPMPLTGVGKVFKPRLRWDAAKRVFTTALTPLRERGIDCKVEVGAHGSHGSVATVTMTGAPAEQRDALTNEVQAILAPYVMRNEIVWN